MIDLWPLQQAIYAALTANPATYPVYDAVPQNSPAPYIVIGEVSNQDDLEISEESSDATVTIHGWSRTAGKAQSYAILSFIRARLDSEVIGGARSVTGDGEDVFEDRSSTAASRLYHAVAQYRFRLN